MKIDEEMKKFNPLKDQNVIVKTKTKGRNIIKFLLSTFFILCIAGGSNFYIYKIMTEYIEKSKIYLKI